MRASCQSFDIALPTVRPLIEWRVEDERRAGCPLWVGEGKGETVSKEYVAGDPVAAVRGHLNSLKELRQQLKDERSEAVERINEIDGLLDSMGDVAKPKRGRPAGSKAKKEVNQQTE